MPLKNWCSIHVRWSKNSLKHSIVSFIVYRSSKVSSRPDCIFEIHQLWQSGFCRLYSNSCCSCSFKPEIIKISQSSHKMYSNKILNFQESTTILNACTKKSGNLLKAPYIYLYTHTHTDAYIYIYIYIYILHAHTDAYIYIYIYIYTHTITDAHIYIYTHTQIKKYTRTCNPILVYTTYTLKLSLSFGVQKYSPFFSYILNINNIYVKFSNNRNCFFF